MWRSSNHSCARLVLLEPAVWHRLVWYLHTLWHVLLIHRMVLSLLLRNVSRCLSLSVAELRHLLRWPVRTLVAYWWHGHSCLLWVHRHSWNKCARGLSRHPCRSEASSLWRSHIERSSSGHCGRLWCWNESLAPDIHLDERIGGSTVFIAWLSTWHELCEAALTRRLKAMTSTLRRMVRFCDNVNWWQSRHHFRR